jgi:predicted DNA-binding protein (UPF0251 family)
MRHTRRIGFLPDATFFKPQGIPMFELEIVVISHEELEAIRLVDFIGLEHEETAQKMGISRKTMAKDLKNGRRKIADALLHGKAIRVEGGNFEYRRGNGIHYNGGNEDAARE